MGLLSKVVSGSYPAELDEMGKALRDRLLRLSQKETSPYTALSLLKAYSSFQIGICASLQEDQYTSYVAVGLGVNQVAIERNQLPLLKEGIQKIEGKVQIPFFNKDMILWVFPLDDEYTSLLIIGVEDTVRFNPHALGLILEQVKHILLFQGYDSQSESFESLEEDDSETTLEEAFQEELLSPAKGEDAEEDADNLELSNPPEALIQQPFSAPPSPAEELESQHEEPEFLHDEPEATRMGNETLVAQALARYAEAHQEFQAIILEYPQDLDIAEIDGFIIQLEAMVSSFGQVCQLTADCALILMPTNIDQELISSHLSRVLRITKLGDFIADTSETALTALQSYL